MDGGAIPNAGRPFAYAVEANALMEIEPVGDPPPSAIELGSGPAREALDSVRRIAQAVSFVR